MTQGKTFAQKLVEERTGRPIEELLRELYVDRRWSHQEIADQLGVSRMVVRDWCARFGISDRDRVTDLGAIL